jgi:chromosome partitioning protein
MDMAKIAAIVNHKGGVKKTFIATAGADALAREGLDVLVVDLDPQAHATALIYSFLNLPAVPIERVLAGQASMPEAIITNTTIPGVHLLGSTLKLANLERELMFSNPFNATRLLADKLAVVADAYDVILIDCPPSLGTLSANALAAADMVVVPVESGSKLSLIGADDILTFIRQAKAANSKLVFGGAILTKHDGRKQVCRIVANEVKASFETVFETALPESTDVSKGQLIGKTILQLDHDHTVSRMTVRLMRELMAKLGIDARRKQEEASHVE